MELIQITNGSEPDPSRKGGLRLEDVQAKLSAAKGPEYWRSLEELAATPEFEELLHREFPRQASEWAGDDFSRRGFMKLMSSSLALAGLSGCTKMPTQTIVPYVRQPEQLVLGRPTFYATAMSMGGYAQPVLARSNEGRPTKIEGNPEHPVSKGATDIFAQGSLLDLYDPDRSQTCFYQGEVRSYPAFMGAMASPLAAQRTSGGAGLRLLTQTISSPTLLAQIRALQQRFPSMKWYQWEPVNRDAVYAGAQMAFGEAVETRYQLENASLIVTLDADFLYAGFPGFTAYTNAWASRRDPDGQNFNRMYSIESTPTTTGFKADHRLAVKPSEVEQYARALATKLGVSSGGGVRPEHQQLLDAIAKDIQANKGKAVVIPGEMQPPAVHALAHAINEAIGAVGSTVVYTDPVTSNTASQAAGIKELAADISAGKVEMLVMVDGNPIFDAPSDLDFAAIITKVPLKVHHGIYFNETAAVCDWHVTGTHYLEAWSDARAVNGTVSVVQPLIAPLYDGHSAHEIVSILNGQPDVSGYDLVRDYWKTQYKGATFEDFWRRSVHDGFVQGTEFQSKSVKSKGVEAASAAKASAGGYEIVFRPDPSIHDGRFANNAWLQELPKPLTKLTWDNVIYVSTNTASKLGIRADQDADVIEVEYRGRKVRGPAWVQPGQPDDTLTVFYGYGRTRSGETGLQKGFNAYGLKFLDEPYFGSGAQVRKTGDRYKVASTQGFQQIEDRNCVRSAKLETYKENPNFAHENTEKPADSETFYPKYPVSGYTWGMSIDLNKCTGCNACIIACQAENNIPVVGKEQTQMGRHMHWIRVDGYYQGDPSSPRMYYEPLPCMQCEDAPCELVCPVGATVHSTEGLNDMVYNRCVGTRYCSNNCPYKVRRFNFLLFQDFDTPQLKMARNPEVSVRSRGVMEKCTYCVQRITQTRIASEEEDRRIRDGELLTACQQVCPASAITFGDISDPQTKVSKLKSSPRNYGILEEINTRPRTTHLAAVLNPNPEFPETQPEQHY